jgi:hypothetical protein
MKKIRMRWNGPDAEMPMHAHYVASARGRGAYLILGVNNRGVRMHKQTGEPHILLVLTVERVGRAAIDQPDAVVHWIVWDRRW